MIDERMPSTLRAIADIFGDIKRKDQSNPTWFVSFGTLLWYVRDRLLDRPFEQDFDISLIYGELRREELIERFKSQGYELDNELLDNYHRKPLQMTFKPKATGLWPADIDLFFWVIGQNYAWHSYDMFNRRQQVQDEYTFKATPKEIFTAPTVQMIWDEIAPPLSFPSKYGSLLDCWYPPTKGPDGAYLINSGWLFQNKQYGQSRAETMKTLKSCKDMRGDLG